MMKLTPMPKTISRALELHEFKWYDPAFHRCYPHSTLADIVLFVGSQISSRAMIIHVDSRELPAVNLLNMCSCFKKQNKTTTNGHN